MLETFESQQLKSKKEANKMQNFTPPLMTDEPKQRKTKENKLHISNFLTEESLRPKVVPPSD